MRSAIEPQRPERPLGQAALDRARAAGDHKKALAIYARLMAMSVFGDTRRRGLCG